MKEKGFALLIAIAVTGTLLLISTGMVNLALKQSNISGAGRDSQLAFYAADTGLECALYWDTKNPSGESAFNITTGVPIECNRDPVNAAVPPGNQWVVGGSSVSSFTMTFLPEPYCATVTVTKNLDGTTQIESKGYNTCDPNSPRRVERAVRATY